MQLTRTAAVTGLLMLAACQKHDQSVSLTNASIDQVAAARKAVKLQPGEWEVTMEIVKQEVTGAPGNPAMPPKMPPITSKTCITPAQVEKPEAMFGQGMEQFKKNCSYDKFEMADGHMSAKMHCALPNGGKAETENDGTFSATEFATTGTSTISGTMPGVTMTTQTRMSAHRVGECTTPPGKPG